MGDVFGERLTDLERALSIIGYEIDLAELFRGITSDRSDEFDRRLSAIEKMVADNADDVAELSRRLEEFERSIRDMSTTLDNLNNNFNVNVQTSQAVLDIAKRLEDSQRDFGNKINRIEENVDRIDVDMLAQKNQGFKVVTTIGTLSVLVGYVLSEATNSDLVATILKMLGM